MRMFKDFEEIKAAVGTEVGVSDWVEVTQRRIDQFAEATGDEQWIHVDVERAARELPGRTTIACPLCANSGHPLRTALAASWLLPQPTKAVGRC